MGFGPESVPTGEEIRTNRRRFMEAVGATGVAAAAYPSVAGATPVEATVATDLDTDGGPQEVLVTFDSNDHVAQLGRFALPEGYHRFEELPIGYAVATGEQIGAIAALDTVRHVQPNRELEYHNADAREETGVASVQSGGNNGEKAHVAVIDSGLSALHPDHQENVRHNYKYQNPLSRDTAWVDVGPADTDDNGHGTHTAGSVAGDGSFSSGSGSVVSQDQRGMAPSADLTVYSTGLTLLVVNTIAAFDHLLANHAPDTAASEEEIVHVTNNSYGQTSGNGVDFNPDSAMSVATYRTYTAGMLHCFSAGNSGPTTNTYSNYAKPPWVVGVAATNDSRELAGFSSRGRTKNYDGITNYDRDLALENVEAHYAATSGEPSAEAKVDSGSFSGGPAAGGAVVGLTQTAGPFTPGAGSPSFDPDGYEVRATLTWSPSTPQGPEPNDLDFTLLDSGGNPVASSGTGGSETQTEASESLTGSVTPGSSYTFEVTGWRGAATWSISYEVYAIQTGNVTDPGRPYGVYRPDVGAPGVSVVSTMGTNDPLQATDNGSNESLASPYYAAISGTSMSSPVTAGSAALLVTAYIDAHPDGARPDPNTVFEALEAGAAFDESKGHTRYNIGTGFVQVPASVTAIEQAAQPDSGTGSEPDRTAPVVDEYTVTERGNPNPHTEITASWNVSDADGDLASVGIKVVDRDTGDVVREAMTDVSGPDATGTDEFRIENSEGGRYDVVLTVTDAAGGTATATETVSESHEDPGNSGDNPGGSAGSGGSADAGTSSSTTVSGFLADAFGI
jgi:serine protease AprX